ncbi:EAL domain-containing protein [Agrobacterium rhizogenes]|nr:EAL domain-containing protein [Rhizobium rhizogenes]
MFSVMACIRDEHDIRLIFVAAAICLIGSLATMLLFSRAQECRSQQRSYWVVAAAFASGVSIWATHFIAMLAYDGGLPISYGLSLTILSVVFAILGSWFAIAVAFEWDNTISFAIGGMLMALGIASMHFTGMQAIQAPAILAHDPSRTLAAIAAGAALGALSFVAFFRMGGHRRIALGTLLLVLAICALHFTAMSGVTLTPDPTVEAATLSIDRIVLAGIIMAASTGLVLIALGAAFVDRHLTDLRGFANASLEGMLIVRDGRVIDANERFVAISGWSLQRLIGKSPGDFLTLDAAMRPEEAASLETALLSESGRSIPVEVVIRTIIYRGHECRVLVVRDLTERRQAQQMIEHLAHHDTLTDLPNRAFFDERIRQALQMAEHKGTEAAVFCLDLDRFKAINDVFGHAEGDRILCKVADILRRSAEDSDTVARLGGDEFAIIQPGQSQPEGARRLAERILAEFAAEMDTARDPTAVGVSLGIAIYPRDGHSAEQLYCNADIALYRVKHTSRGFACFFDAGMDETVRTRRQIESDLRQAILRRQLHVDYQPILDAQNGQISGYEALLRWDHPVRGVIEPDTFIPIAEESGSIVQLGEWVLEQACIEAARWHDKASIAVNVSPVQFMIPTLYDQVAQILARTGLDPHRLELEITEAALMRDRVVVLSTLQRLHRLGVRVVMDDFGTGYSSLSNLRAFPFDKIKVDRSFTGALEHDPAARSIVRAIIGLGHSLNIPVVTEGVETESQRRIVVEEGCAQLQGFLLGKPDIEPSSRFSASDKTVA